MARRYVPQIFDDLDGTELTEPDATEIHFSVCLLYTSDAADE